MFKNHAEEGSGKERSLFGRLLEEETNTSPKYRVNSVIKGVPVLITRDGAYISTKGNKVETLIPANQLPQGLVVDKEDEFLVISEPDELGQLVLSYAWTVASRILAEGKTVDVYVNRVFEKGADVNIPEIGNISAFAPRSLLPVTSDQELQALSKKTIKAKITEMKLVDATSERKAQRRLIVSPLAVTREQQLEFLKGLFRGQTVTAKLRKLTPTFAVALFEDSGATGLIVGSEFAMFGEKEDLTDAFNAGASVELDVIEVDITDKNKPLLKLSRRSVLARKRKAEILANLKTGDIVTARVTQLPEAGWGAFVVVEECLAGFIGRENIPGDVKRADQALTKNQIIKARYIGTHKKSGNLTLSLLDVDQNA